MMTRQKRITARHAKIQAFQESAAALSTNNIFGLPFSVKESEVVLTPVPWEVTVSFRPGTAKGPEAICEASGQVDLYDPFTHDAWKYGFAMERVDRRITEMGAILRATAAKLIHCQQYGTPDDLPVAELTRQVNEGGARLNRLLEIKSLHHLERGKIVGIVGGDHSAPLGLMRALAKHHSHYGILHIDAHFDHRDSYEGFEFSHASIMRNASYIPEIEKFVHVGIRDYCKEEMDVVIRSPERFFIYTDSEISDRKFCSVVDSSLSSISWHTQCQYMISHLPKHVYISFDIDGLDQTLCPNTGTPVPGGLNFQEVRFLLEHVVKSGRKIIGFDLCEVAPAPNCENFAADWNANVGSRILYKLCSLAAQSVFGPHKD
ncbi:MAG: agmatinase family protein [bacterium]|nr:agmatinase family protein [bacterium]MDZ4285349.1 agmatinase family protein [Candidatus Sungbacteria bacterium]